MRETGGLLPIARAVDPRCRLAHALFRHAFGKKKKAGELSPALRSKGAGAKKGRTLYLPAVQRWVAEPATRTDVRRSRSLGPK